MAVFEQRPGVTSLSEREPQRRVGFVALDSIIGSGWLLGTLTPSKVAGPVLGAPGSA